MNSYCAIAQYRGEPCKIDRPALNYEIQGRVLPDVIQSPKKTTFTYFSNNMFLNPVYKEFYKKPNLNTTYRVSYMVYWQKHFFDRTVTGEKYTEMFTICYSRATIQF